MQQDRVSTMCAIWPIQLWLVLYISLFLAVHSIQVCPHNTNSFFISTCFNTKLLFNIFRFICQIFEVQYRFVHALLNSFFISTCSQLSFYLKLSILYVTYVTFNKDVYSSVFILTCSIVRSCLTLYLLYAIYVKFNTGVSTQY